MKYFSALFPVGLLALLFLTLRLPAAAQAPAWQSAQVVAVATAAANSNTSMVTATAVDAAGNVILAGSFSGTVVLGGTTLTSRGGGDAFVAKFSPVSNQFVWAQQAGGVNHDGAGQLAVNGTNVYVAGYFTSPTADFGSTTLTNGGASDIFVAKLTDTGPTASFAWAQRAGGTGDEAATALAVSGTDVYMAGFFISPTATFGPTTLTKAGPFGFSDIFVAKLTDTGPTADFAWVQRAGGTGEDKAMALAVSGSSVYVAGYFQGSIAVFGSTTLTNAGAYDVFVTKLTDAGGFVWEKQAGGPNAEVANALAVNGASVYLAGNFNSATASFGATTLTRTGLAFFNNDIFLAKLTDAGSTASFAWAQQAGGAGIESANTLAVSGTNVYVAGSFDSDPAGFGATALATTGYRDVFVAKLTDVGNAGRFIWAQQAGGASNDELSSLVVSGTSVYVAGYFGSFSASFLPIIVSSANPASNSPIGYLASLNDAPIRDPLTATAAASPREPAQLFPNPARRTATLRLSAGTAPAPLVLTDAMGRAVRRYPAPAGPEAVLDLDGLHSGLYLLRGAGPAQRLAVE